MYPLLTIRIVDPAGKAPVDSAATPVEVAVTYTPLLMVSTYVPGTVGLPNRAAMLTFDVSAAIT
jgi:hypothetical protein